MDYSNIILEMLLRIKKLEQDVAQLQSEKSNERSDVSRLESEIQTFGRRDTTRYLFQRAVYPKNRLVLAVVKAYVDDNYPLTREQLRGAFDKSLQGSIGVVENVETAKNRNDYDVRFFTKPQEMIHLADGDMYVCTQWGIGNIVNFLKRAKQLGFEIETI